MITIDSPSMALNDSRAVGAYTMDFNRYIQPGTSVGDMVRMVLDEAATVTGGVIQNLILNAHGSPGDFELGLGLNRGTMAPCAELQGHVFKIWFRGCAIARIAGPGTLRHGDAGALRLYGYNSGDGHVFIKEFARLTGCYVVAPTELQVRNRDKYPRKQMDSYEGLVLCYDPSGAISWQHRYPSVYHHDTWRGTAITPNRE
jgi:hypothetical protein